MIKRSHIRQFLALVEESDCDLRAAMAGKDNVRRHFEAWLDEMECLPQTSRSDARSDIRQVSGRGAP